MEIVSYHDVLQFKNSIFYCTDVTESTRKRVSDPNLTFRPFCKTAWN